jgi:hypothetical protein
MVITKHHDGYVVNDGVGKGKLNSIIQRCFIRLFFWQWRFKCGIPHYIFARIALELLNYSGIQFLQKRAGYTTLAHNNITPPCP